MGNFNQMSKCKYVNPLITAIILIELTKVVFSFSFFQLSGAISYILTAMAAIFALLSVAAVFSRLSKCVRIIWCLLIVASAISYFQHFSGLEYLTNTFTLIGFLTVIPYYKFNKNILKSVLVVYAIVVVLVIMFGNRYGESQADAVISSNTNTFAFLLLAFECMLLALALTYRNKKSKRFICYLAVIIILFFHVQFSGRSSLIGLFLIVVYVLFKKYFDKIKNKSLGVLIFALCVFGVVFAYLYAIVLFDLIGYGKIRILGKDIFSGRQNIWRDAFEQIQGQLMFGIGNRLESIAVNNDTGFTNLHNQMMGWLITFGLPVFLLISILLGLILSAYCRKNKSKFFIAVMIMFIIISYFDTILYSTANVPMVILLLFVAAGVDRKINAVQGGVLSCKKQFTTVGLEKAKSQLR